jgi:Fe-Mn family superoxide dismutase
MRNLELISESLVNQILGKEPNQVEFFINEAKTIGIDKLSYSYAAIRRFIDPETMKIHYQRHYKGYVKKLNSALRKKDYGDVELENIVKQISKYNTAIRNNAGGAFNHALFWRMLSPKPQVPSGPVLEKIKSQFGTYRNFRTKFEKEAKARFGSGWVWLVIKDNGGLKIMTTQNQDNPLMNIIDQGGFPILGLDLWEHAYYLKYQNKRDEYIQNFWEVVNWKFVNELYLKKIKGSKKTQITETIMRIVEQSISNEYTFTNKTENNDYVTYKNLDRKFDSNYGEDVILINKNNPSEIYKHKVGKDIFKSGYRENEVYIKKIKNPVLTSSNTNYFENSQFIRDCVKEAFPMSEYTWQEDNDEWTEGLRGVFPYSKDDDWSVLNFFDTNPHRKKKLYELFLKSGQPNQKKWLVNFFRGDSLELNQMTSQQREAIKRADETEIEAMSLITNNFSTSEKKGLKQDRYSSIDAVNNDNGETLQIKNVESVTKVELVDEETGEIQSYWKVVGRNSRLGNYKNKKELDKLVYYIRPLKTAYVFDNSDYDFFSKDLVHHYSEPKIYK